MPKNFTNQPIDRAVVPLMFGNPGSWREDYRNQWARATDDDLYLRQQWSVIWGVYAFRDADRPINEAGEHPWTLAEAAMLQSEWTHDFCGGVQGSSASVMFFNGSKVYWGSLAPRACRLAPAMWNQFTLCNPGANVPILHDGLLANRALTHDEVKAILSRSLMFWSMSKLYQQGKRGVFAYDRSEEDGRTRNVFRHAKDLSWLCTRAHSYKFSTVSPAQMMGDPDSYYSGITGVDDSKAVEVVTAVDEGAIWRNNNSGRMVGPVQAVFNLGDSIGDKESDDEEYYDEEEDEYRPARYRDYDDVQFPAWYTGPSATLQYQRMFPRSMFNN